MLKYLIIAGSFLILNIGYSEDIKETEKQKTNEEIKYQLDKDVAIIKAKLMREKMIRNKMRKNE